MKPRFVHDCSRCKYLGSLFLRVSDCPGWYDLYSCDQSGTMPTVIARYGDEGSEYMSGLGMHLLPLTVAELIYNNEKEN